MQPLAGQQTEGSNTSKAEVKNIIGEYLQKLKNVLKLICEFAYGKKGTEKAVSKRKDIVSLEIFWTTLGFSIS